MSIYSAKSQDSVQVIISTCVTYDECDDYLGIDIIDSLTQQIIYDTNATVYFSSGYRDTIYLQSPGIYKIKKDDSFGMGAHTCDPIVIVDETYKVPFSAVVNNAWLIELPNTSGTDWEMWNGLCCACIYWGAQGLCNNPNADPCINFSGIGEYTFEHLDFYPNPASDQITIEHVGKEAILTITDTRGKIVLEKKLMNWEETIDVSMLSKGVYTVHVENALGRLIIK